MMVVRRSLAMFCLVLAASLAAHAQPLHLAATAPLMPDVLGPAPRVWWIGPQIGANINTHDGDILTRHCNCEFEDGSGAGISAGVEVGHLFSPAVGLVVKALYDDFSADFTNTVVEMTLLKTGEYVPLEYRRDLAVRLGYLTFSPMLEVLPIGGLYMMAGPGVGLLVNGTQEYTKTLTDENYEFDTNGESTAVVQRDSGDIPEAEQLRVDLRAGLGYNLRLGKRVSFAPEVSYIYPLTNISTDDNWSASAIHMMGVLKIAL